MNVNTKHLIETLGPGVAKKVLMLQSAWFVSHGLLSSNETETYVSLGLSVIGALWSFWNEYGEAIFRSQMEVIKAKSLAQAAKLRDAGLPKVTASEIADQSPKLSTADVVKIASTLPPAIQGNIAADMTTASVKAALMVLLAIALASLVATGSAQAQSHRLAPPAVTGDLKKDLNTDAQNLGLIPKSLVVTPTGNIAADLQTLWGKIIGAADTDLAYASKMAASAATPASAVRKQCWDAIIVVNMQANGQNLKNADGSVMAKPDPHVFTDVESLAEVVDNLSPSGPLFTACAGAAQLAKTNVLTFINAVVTGAAGLAAMPIIPGL